MKKFKIKINPISKEISYEIEGDLDDIEKIDANDIKRIEKHFLKLQNKASLKNNESKKRIKKNNDEEKPIQQLELKIPSNLVEKVELLKNENIKFPILWSFSTQEKMTVNEFFELVSNEGFSLSTSWLPKTGGNFSSTLVKRDKIFHLKEKKGSENIWAFTKVGKLKVEKHIQKLKKNS